ncbi:MAG: PQQ-binding-like beta-propeller repeat protein [Deltaproteobacteria bacterium]|nr:PQQ-binding-like beta-propeller repeat protein [Deltaproteobacteria bacterium]
MAALTPSQQVRAALAAGDHQAVLAAFADVAALEARVAASLDELLADLHHVLRAGPTPLPAEASLVAPSGARLDRGALALLETLLDVRRDDLTRTPALLLPTLHNELFWHDAPARADHHDGPPPAAPTTRVLWRWMEDARAAFEARPGARWLRALRPSRPVAALPAWRTWGQARALSPDGDHLLLRQHEPPALHLLHTRNGRRVGFPDPQSLAGDFAPDGACFAIRVGACAELWSTTTLTRQARFGPFERVVERVLFSHDGGHLLIDTGSTLRSCRIGDPSALATRSFGGGIPGLLASPLGVLVHDGTGWQLWDPDLAQQTGATMRCDYIEWSALSPRGDRLLGCGDGQVRCWALPAGELVFERKRPGSALCVHPDGSRFADGNGGVYDTSTGAELRRLPTSGSDGVGFSPDGRWLVSARGGVVSLWDHARGTLAARVPSGRLLGHRVYWDAHSRVLVVGDKFHTRIADLDALVPPVEWRDDARAAAGNHMLFSPSGATLVVDHQGAICFWDTARGHIRHSVAMDRVLTTFAEGARVLIRQGDDLCALATEDGAELWRTRLPGSPYADLRPCHPHGALLQSSDGAVVALAMADGRELYRLPDALLVAHAPDAFVTRNAARDVSLRAAATGVALVTLPAVPGDGFTLSPDQRWLAVRGSDVTVWDLTTSTLRHTFTSDHLPSLRFSADSATLIVFTWQSPQSGNSDWNNEDVYDLATGKCISSHDWYDSGSPPAPPRTLAPGVILGDGSLEVHGTTLPVPDPCVVHLAPSGNILVAAVQDGRVALYVLEPASPA